MEQPERITSPHVMCSKVSKSASTPKDSHQTSTTGSQVAWETLHAAYKELASHDVQLLKNASLAQFEILLDAASPIISYSNLHNGCGIFLGNLHSKSFVCKHQIPNLLLQEVWKWYEEPGCYGLAVKIDNSMTLDATAQSDSNSFHFVPYLSAVQLFGHPELENACSTTSEGTSELNLESRLLASPFDSKLIFQFFESEQPEQRKPFYDKIQELIGFKTSNQTFYGDPSKWMHESARTASCIMVFSGLVSHISNSKREIPCIISYLPFIRTFGQEENYK